jgi:hypothetical protein
VCSVRENKTDEKRFCICTGTKKRIHLRAESKEDRAMWMEAMMAVKSMYPRLPTTTDVLSPSASVVISTDKLRQRLLQEDVNEVLIRECEDIMRAELFQLHTYIVALKQKQLLLTDTLRNLEVFIKINLFNFMHIIYVVYYEAHTHLCLCLIC